MQGEEEKKAAVGEQVELQYPLRVISCNLGWLPEISKKFESWVNEGRGSEKQWLAAITRDLLEAEAGTADVVLLQEMWSLKAAQKLHALVVSRFPFAAFDTSWGRKLVGLTSGLCVLSKYPIRRQRLFHFKKSNNFGNENMARKGVMCIEIDLAGSVPASAAPGSKGTGGVSNRTNFCPVVIATTHLQSPINGWANDALQKRGLNRIVNWIDGAKGSIEEVKQRQLLEVDEAIDEFLQGVGESQDQPTGQGLVVKRTGVPVIMCGDLNVKAHRRNDLDHPLHTLTGATDTFDSSCGIVCSMYLADMTGLNTREERLDVCTRTRYRHRIDYMFTMGRRLPQASSVLNNCIDWPTADHLTIVGDFVIPSAPSIQQTANHVAGCVIALSLLADTLASKQSLPCPPLLSQRFSSSHLATQYEMGRQCSLAELRTALVAQQRQQQQQQRREGKERKAQPQGGENEVLASAHLFSNAAVGALLAGYLSVSIPSTTSSSSSSSSFSSSLFAIASSSSSSSSSKRTNAISRSQAIAAVRELSRSLRVVHVPRDTGSESSSTRPVRLVNEKHERTLPPHTTKSEKNMLWLTRQRLENCLTLFLVATHHNVDLQSLLFSHAAVAVAVSAFPPLAKGKRVKKGKSGGGRQGEQESTSSGTPGATALAQLAKSAKNWLQAAPGAAPPLCLALQRLRTSNAEVYRTLQYAEGASCMPSLALEFASSPFACHFVGKPQTES